MLARTLLLTLATGALAAGAFGASASTSPPSTVSVKAVDYAFVMPNVVKGGVVVMRFRNADKELHEFGFGRIDNGHTLTQVIHVRARPIAGDGSVEVLHHLNGHDDRFLAR